MRALRARKAARVGEITLIPLYLIQTNGIEQTRFCWVSGSAEPFAMVLVGTDEVQVTGIDGAELDVEVLQEKIPGLESTIQQWKTTLKSNWM